MSFRLPPLPACLEGSGALASSLGGPRPSAGRRVPPAPGADGQGGWLEDEEPGGLEDGWDWPGAAGGRLDDYEEESGDGL